MNQEQNLKEDPRIKDFSENTSLYIPLGISYYVYWLVCGGLIIGSLGSLEFLNPVLVLLMVVGICICSPAFISMVNKSRVEHNMHPFKKTNFLITSLLIFFLPLVIYEITTTNNTNKNSFENSKTKASDQTANKESYKPTQVMAGGKIAPSKELLRDRANRLTEFKANAKNFENAIVGFIDGSISHTKAKEISSEWYSTNKPIIENFIDEFNGLNYDHLTFSACNDTLRYQNIIASTYQYMYSALYSNSKDSLTKEVLRIPDYTQKYSDHSIKCQRELN